MRSQGHPLGPNLIIIKHWRKFFVIPVLSPDTRVESKRACRDFHMAVFETTWIDNLENTETCDLQEKGQTGICVFFLISKVTLRTSELRF